jgi:hypothetical protein
MDSINFRGPGCFKKDFQWILMDKIVIQTKLITEMALASDNGRKPPFLSHPSETKKG